MLDKLYHTILRFATISYNSPNTDKGAEAMPTTYPSELKVKTIRRYEKGESIKALSQELHISQSTLCQWRKEYCLIKTPTRTYTPAEFDAISRRIQKLEHHMEIIRQSGYLSVPLQKKLATFEELYNRQTILLASMSCAMLLMWQGGPSITTSSVRQTEANTKRNRLNSC